MRTTEQEIDQIVHRLDLTPGEIALIEEAAGMPENVGSENRGQADRRDLGEDESALAGLCKAELEGLPERAPEGVRGGTDLEQEDGEVWTGEPGAENA